LSRLFRTNTEPADQAAQLAALASHDGLTGMPNRRTWEGELPVAMDRARRDGVPISVALLDLDHFKRFNDQHGHQAGDRLLNCATAAWSAMLRTTDLLCRYGERNSVCFCPAQPPSRLPRCWSGSAP
jgi:diguanylate cyclase (GGDEF)-like protein